MMAPWRRLSKTEAQKLILRIDILHFSFKAQNCEPHFGAGKAFQQNVPKVCMIEQEDVKQCQDFELNMVR